mmetsp:Transcript_6649/g.15918  ORF Transcript_6649/g.15918 Transcript_6649/m.15918 type:complete len:266 (-) Transcript_6649:1621-2418(-)
MNCVAGARTPQHNLIFCLPVCFFFCFDLYCFLIRAWLHPRNHLNAGLFAHNQRLFVVFDRFRRLCRRHRGTAVVVVFAGERESFLSVCCSGRGNPERLVLLAIFHFVVLQNNVTTVGRVGCHHRDFGLILTGTSLVVGCRRFWRQGNGIGEECRRRSRRHGGLAEQCRRRSWRDGTSILEQRRNAGSHRIHSLERKLVPRGSTIPIGGGHIRSFLERRRFGVVVGGHRVGSRYRSIFRVHCFASLLLSSLDIMLNLIGQTVVVAV